MTQIVITTNTGINYTWTGNQVILPDQKLTMLASGPQTCFTNEKKPVAAQYSSTFAHWFTGLFK